MDTKLKTSASVPQIQRYGAGAFIIGGREYRGSVAVCSDNVRDWEITRFTEIDEASLLAALEGGGVEILVVGSGEKQEFFPPALSQALRARGVAVECMDTGAACRTFNILLQEDRKVAAALIAV